MLLLALLGILLYRVISILKIPGQNEVLTTSDRPENKRKSLNPQSLKIKVSKNMESKTKVYESPSNSPDDSFAVFDKMEKNWLKSAEEIMGRDKFVVYTEMRTRNEKEKMQAYKEYHDYLREKYGDKFSYNISEDQSVREKEINQRYLKDLLKLLGEEKFREYTLKKDQINEKLRRDNQTSITIEY